MITCPTCGAENRQEAKVCRLCSVPLGGGATPREPKTENINTESTIVLSVGQVICPACNAENEEGWIFCQSCGGKLRQSAPAEEALPAEGQIPAPAQIQSHEAIDRPNPLQQRQDTRTVGSGSLTS